MHGRALAALALAVGLPRLACPQAAPFWRFWSVTEGLKESYSTNVSVDGAGRVWVKHSNVDKISVLDGYSAGTIPSPVTFGKLVAAADGSLWLFDGVSVRHYDGARWTSFAVPALSAWPPLQRTVEQDWSFGPNSKNPLYHASVTPLACPGRALFLLPDRFLELDARTGEWTTAAASEASGLGPYTEMSLGWDGRIWVTAAKGLLSVTEAPPGTLKFQEYRAPPELSGFSIPREGNPGEVFTGASTVHGRVLVLFDGKRWTPFYKPRSLRARAWRGSEQDIWVEDSNEVIRLSGEGQERVANQGALTGIILDVTPEHGGRFWLSTSQGIARFAPPLWRAPAGFTADPDLDTAFFKGITEDQSGNLWFVNPAFLVRFDGKAFQKFPFPPAERPPSGPTPSDIVRALPDGRLALLTSSGATLLIFDPRRGSFTSIHHPQGRLMRLFGAHNGEGIFVETTSATDLSSCRIEIFDGHAFHPYANLDGEFPKPDLNVIYETARGDVWLGGPAILGVLRNGSLRKFQPGAGRADAGALDLYEISPGRLLVAGRNDVAVFDGKTWNSVHGGLDRARTIARSADGTFWIGSGTGVFRYQPNAWIANGLDDGLPSPAIYKIFRDSRGKIWAATARGISLFHPDADRDAPKTIMPAEKNAREASPDGQVHLVFTGLDKWNYTPPHRLLFSYRLDNASWSRFEAGGSAALRKLRAGKHHFEVRAMDRNGNADPGFARFDFSVLVPWYRTRGFQCLAAGAACLIAMLLVAAYGNYRYRGNLISQLHVARKLEHDQNEILKMIAKRAPLRRILAKVAEAVRTCEPEGCCLIVIATGGEMKPAASSGFSGEFSMGFDCSQISSESGAGMEIAAAQPSAIPAELEADADWHEFRERALACGLHACHAVPVRSGQSEVLAIIEIYHPDLLRFANCQAELFETIARLAAMAIESDGLYRELEYRAQHDSLTGLPNRLYFRERLRQVFAESRREQRGLALFYIDLDRFKLINDSLGHGVGDEFLRQVAARFSDCAPHGSILARMGGDEFMLLAGGIAANRQAEEVARGLLDALRQPLWVCGHELFASASIGISVFPSDGEDEVSLQKNADCAMYRAKEQGRNGYECFSRERRAPLVKPEAERDFGRILDGAGLYFEPRFALSGELAGVEAQIRVRQPDLVQPSPSQPVLDEAGWPPEFGIWMLNEACRRAAAWQRAGYRPLRIAIHIGKRQLNMPDFGEMVAAALKQNSLPGSALELELKEAAILLDPANSAKRMEYLRALGIGLALDGFGTGYSSLGHLDRLPISLIKLGPAFVRDLDTATGSLTLVQSIVELAHRLRIQTAAEGVERWSQHRLLRQTGCDLAQGPLLSHPLSPQQIEELLIKANGPTEVLEPQVFV